MKEYWIMVACLGLLLAYGTVIVLLGSKFAKLARANAAPQDMATVLQQGRYASNSYFRVTRADVASFLLSRRAMQFVLGLLWLTDGVFQLKPEMFTTMFVKQVVLPVSQSEPSVISFLVTWGAHVVAAHPVVWDALFAAIQIGIGISLMMNVKVKQVIFVSLIWSLVVWVFGEGVGQIFTGQSLLLSGSPGAVMLYALIGIAVWPPAEGSARIWRARGVRFAQISVGAIMVFGFLLHLQPSALDPNGLSQAISVPWLAAIIGSEGTIASVVLGVVELCLAAMLFLKIGLRTAVWGSVLLSLVYWWAGQSFGQISEPLATDFNTGLVLAVLALCAYPAMRGRECTPSGPLTPQ